ncbi:MAG: UDP-N-acetylglucosamine 2-epimerase [Patescibacteria group bacterium]|nr:UDP-N-acetylglucosamine 2-epimerase [Patescibacteria group bacterium]
MSDIGNIDSGMRQKRKVCVVIIGRANYGRIKTALDAIRKHPDLELQIIGGSSLLLERHGKGVDVMRAEGFEVDHEAYMAVEGETPLTMAKSVGLGILEITNALNRLKPDVVLTIADRFETIATAIAASYMNIPVAHTQGGEVTGSIDEHVRHAVTKLAHIHFPATQSSGERLIKMGESPDTIHVTGCPAIDIVAQMERNFRPEEIEMLGYQGVGPKIDVTKPYILMMQHPVTTEYGSGHDQVMETVEAIKMTGMPAIALWPNIDAGSDQISKALRIFREFNPEVPIRFYKNFPPETYARILANAACAVGNSSSFIREGSYLGTPAIIVGSRQHGREHGRNVMMEVPHDRQSILDALNRQLANGRYESDPVFGDGKAGERIAEVLARATFRVQKSITY